MVPEITRQRNREHCRHALYSPHIWGLFGFGSGAYTEPYQAKLSQALDGMHIANTLVSPWHGWAELILRRNFSFADIIGATFDVEQLTNYFTFILLQVPKKSETSAFPRRCCKIRLAIKPEMVYGCLAAARRHKTPILYSTHGNDENSARTHLRIRQDGA